MSATQARVEEPPGRSATKRGGVRSLSSTPPALPEVHKHCFPAEPISVSRAREAVNRFAQATGAAEEAVHTMLLAVSEAVSNVVLHAYRESREPGWVSLELSRPKPPTLRAVVADGGMGMVPRPDSPGIGMGLPLIAQLADTVEFGHRPGGGTDVVMCFNA